MKDDDYELDKDWLARSCRSNGVAVWSYWLMPSHVHLILVPLDDTRLSPAVGEAHRRYSGYINSRLRVTGHLFQGRFGCVAMDDSQLMGAFRYVALSSVKAELATTAVDGTWSSTPAHSRGKDDGLVTVKPILGRVGRLDEFLDMAPDPDLEAALAKGQAIGRPLWPGKRGRRASPKTDARQRKFV